ncbi:alpha/beta hydrolase family esterase [Streptomyces agglomeratus]|uniref:alpha/beta hydrolase family esterase n=1 Tax=Streptomyces agglomeratus TaxID=285458 RepID=UPI000B1BE18D|nr:PHB depolymerase family esterase [Streptomyces agglomeratus]
MRIRPGTPTHLTLWSAVVATLLSLGACRPTDAEHPRKQLKPTETVRETPRPGDQKIAMTWDGKKRVYRVHAPPGYTPDKKLPLIVAMHPYPSTGEFVSRLSGLDERADRENFLVAYPDGLDLAYNALSCCGDEDDVGFIRAMTKRLVDRWKADPDRVYATGISNGADMSFKVAVELHETFAAIAPVSGAYSGPDTQDASYVPRTPVSVITFIGGRDKLYNTADTAIEAWHERLSCKPAPARKLKDQITRTSAKCRDKSEVVTYRIPQMSHSWPGAEPGDMAAPEAGVNATDLMLEFFASHPKQRS